MISKISLVFCFLIYSSGVVQAADNNLIKLIPYYNCVGCYTVQVMNPFGPGSYTFNDGFGFNPAAESPDSLHAYVVAHTVTVVGDSPRWGRIDVVSFGRSSELLADEHFAFQEIASNKSHSIWAVAIAPLFRKAYPQYIDVIDPNKTKGEMVETVFDCTKFGEPLSTQPAMQALTWMPRKAGFIFLNSNNNGTRRNNYLFVALLKNKKWILKKLMLNFDFGDSVVWWEHGGGTVVIRTSGGIIYTVELETGVCRELHSYTATQLHSYTATVHKIKKGFVLQNHD